MHSIALACSNSCLTARLSAWLAMGSKNRLGRSLNACGMVGLELKRFAIVCVAGFGIGKHTREV